MELEFSSLRNDLDNLGYFQTVSIESLPLVAKLLNDLKTTTTSLQKYINLAQNGKRENKNIHLSTEIYKTDCSKILTDCNDSHSTHLNHRSDTEREIKELRRHLSILAREKSKLVLENDGLRKKVYDTELDQMKSLRPTRQTHGNYFFQSENNCPSSDGELLQENFEMKHELNQLKKELKNLQCQCNHLDSKGLAASSSNEEDILLSKHFQEKVFRLLDDVRNLTKEKNEMDKSYKEALAKQHEAMRRAIHLAERNRELERELKDIDQMAVAVEEECNDTVNDRTKKLAQYESALRDALVEIQRLEKTISSMKKEKWESEVNKDVDESEKNQVSCTCNESGSANLNEQLNNMKIIEQDLNLEIDRLVRENNEQKRMIAEMEYRLSTSQAPQRLTDNGPGGDSISISIKQKKKSKGKRIKSQKKTKRKGKGGKKDKQKLKKRNKFLKNPKTNNNISHVPVNSPIEKKMSNVSQNYFPADSLHLPSADTAQTDFVKTLESSTQTETSKNPCYHFKKPLVSCVCDLPIGMKCCTEKTTLSDAFRNGCCTNMCFEHFQVLLRKEIENCFCKVLVGCDAVAARDLRNVFARKTVVQHDVFVLKVAAIDCCSQCPKMKQKIDFMQQENKRLSDEKITLISRLETSRDNNEIFGKCHRSACKRTERERDLFKADVARLEEESDCLRDKLKELCESKKREQESLRQQVNDYERALRKIENEHSELLNTQNTRRAQINAVDKKNEFLEEMLCNSQDDLKNQKILYVQLKALHDQTDKALFNTQTQLNELEQELASARNTIEMFKTAKPKADEYNRIAEGDLNSIKRQLNKIDREKDDLLNIVDSKTEEIATLRQNLKTKCDFIESLRSENSQLRSKCGDATDRATSSGAILKESEIEIRRLQTLLDDTTRTKNNAVDMNRKLQEELAAMSREMISLKNQVSSYQDQIEDLKLQSQQYIGEVKKAEDLLQNKEKEREDLLNQFKQLCKESSDLQSSQYVLETQASESKVQLSVAMDHVTSLEERSETLEILINDYEKQIGLLTNQIAKMEIERNQYHLFQERTEAELRTIRELCMKLDKEKENLRIQLLDSGRTDDKVGDLLRQNQLLETKLSDAASKLSNAEKLLNEARQEGVEMKLKNEDSVGEIQYLKEKITELEQSLVRCLCKVCSTKCSTGFEMCEKKCLDLKNKDDAATTSQKTNEESRRPSSLTSTVGAIEPLVSRLFDKPLFFNAKTNKSQTDSLITNCSKDAIAFDTQIMTTSVNSSEISNFSDFSNGRYQPKYIFKETTHETLKANPMNSIPPTIKENDIWNYQPKDITPNAEEGVNSRSKILKRNVAKSICKEFKCHPNCTLYNPRDKVCNKFNSTNYILKNNSSADQL